ncbi:hypothetical protein [Paenibacillus guangzhouensis]|uniref:hypothetical protein n=1 Tax=Paenibacillus guangzhouensis TaxID=1473112 RepID=UPI001266C3F7|nr:hypothetical protein [Paenibacillus guangzhouensis]
MTRFPELFRELDAHLSSYGQSSLSKMVLWYGCDQYENEMDIEVGRGLKEPIPETSQVAGAQSLTSELTSSSL